ncbi:uncharacterized protein [Rutidosis leptorrhynchoides]|uniref:uncharacterized protein n=1 Tax=Rutidosis leptorrhynchoides TaxID=125765 RepID=UPI003A9A209E
MREKRGNLKKLGKFLKNKLKWLTPTPIGGAIIGRSLRNEDAEDAIIRNISGRAIGEIQELEHLIRSVERNKNGMDVWKWNLNSSGLFTTKKMQLSIEEKALSEGRGQFETLRNNLVPKKVEIFIWRAMHKRISVLIELDKRGVDLQSVRCPICDDDIETIDHSLIFCNKVFELWSRVYKWWNLGNYTNLSIHETFKGVTNSTSSLLGGKIWQAVEWTCRYMIWKNRNNKVFKNKQWCVPSALSEIQVISFDWISHRIKGRNIDWNVWLVNPQVYLTQP